MIHNYIECQRKKQDFNTIHLSEYIRTTGVQKQNIVLKFNAKFIIADNLLVIAICNSKVQVMNKSLELQLQKTYSRVHFPV